MKGAPLTDEDGSLMSECHVQGNSLIHSVYLFNEIGRVSQSGLVS